MCATLEKVLYVESRYTYLSQSCPINVSYHRVFGYQSLSPNSPANPKGTNTLYH